MQLSSRLAATLRLIAYAFVTLSLIPIQALAIRINKRLSVRVPFYYHKLCLKIFKYPSHQKGPDFNKDTNSIRC